MKKLWILTVVLFFTASCRDAEVDEPDRVVNEWDFSGDAQGWEGDFADYPVGKEEFMGLDFEYETLPEPLDENQGALKLTGTNTSDDLFMFAKKRIADLTPGRVYNITFTVQFASNVPDDLAGIGGSPGESVWIKAGATSTEPAKEVDDMDYYRMNIDKGGQSQGGSDMVVLGDFSNDTDQQVYALKTVTNSEQSFSVMPNESGELWIIVGTDSGFEGNTTIYYNSIKVELFF